MTNTSDRLALRLGALFGLFGVILGAMAAHGPVHDYLDRVQGLDMWRTALNYQWFHALALLAVGAGAVGRRGTVICWLIGTVLFSGSIYFLSLEPPQTWKTWVGPITPLGGLFLICGWAWLWFSLIRKPAI